MRTHTRAPTSPGLPRPETAKLEARRLRGEEARRLAEIDSPEARAALARHAPEQLAAALQELPSLDRMAVLEQADRLPEIVPCLPELTLVQTICDVGLDEAGWLVVFASPEQRVAALDLDCWQDRRLSPSRLFEWIDALIEAGTETLLAAFEEFDAEIWILALQWMADFSIPGLGGSGGEADPWDDGAHMADGATLDGVVFYSTRSGDHEERIRQLLETARVHVPSVYWDFVYGAITEPPRSCEEAAARWHQGRLNDLGFPDVERAMDVYRPLRVEQVPVVESPASPAARATEVSRVFSGTALGRALAELPPDRASDVQRQLFELANAIAVADRICLTDAQALARSVGKALEGVDRGLSTLAAERQRSLGEVADTTPTRDLFRLGATLQAGLRPRHTLGELEDREASDTGFDWNVLDEWISEADQTLAPDGRLRR